MTTRIAVICPGRGTYNAPELGYIQRHHQDGHPEKARWLAAFDAYRRKQGLPTITELDSAPRYQMTLHSRGEHASALIFACAWLDWLSIDRERFGVNVITGNSMGWYIALACAGAVDPVDALHMMSTTGRLMQEQRIGGQVVYPVVDADWRPDEARKAALRDLMATLNARYGNEEAFLSIDLGGMWVLAGTDRAIQDLMAELPPVDDRFPLKLYNHAAFHTPLQRFASEAARKEISADIFSVPRIPLVDGRGRIWTPWSTDTLALHAYTLGHQITHTYFFSHAVEMVAKEYAPTHLVILGPGETLGAPVAQTLIRHRLKDLTCKADFSAAQAGDTPPVISMGRPGQRALICVS
ncbi:ACP S-malonyltransferase [Hahella sp. SMD15-11]|uniref:[acyl-carrier-protein] S-malonyltransferase n=1 Tax=Thermohahella caldifontis TaxID=3142973 RepID=A0AB39UUZ0_9GAMM